MAASFNKVLAVVCAMSVLTACTGDMDELDAYINDIKAKPGGRIEPLPEITPYETFTYTADVEGLRSPFQPDSQQATGPVASGVTIDDERLPEYLEQFPLDTLRMVGTLELGENEFGLVQTTHDGLIHRVTPGNYVGQNHGRITTISEAEIALVEIISDGIGGYIERDAALGLSN